MNSSKCATWDLYEVFSYWCPDHLTGVKKGDRKAAVLYSSMSEKQVEGDSREEAIIPPLTSTKPETSLRRKKEEMTQREQEVLQGDQ